MNLLPTPGFGILEGITLFISFLGSLLYLIQAYILFCRPVKTHHEIIVIFATSAFLIYFGGNFMALFSRTLISDAAVYIYRCGWIVALAGVCAIPSLLMHSYGTYYYQTRNVNASTLKVNIPEKTFYILHLGGAFFFIYFLMISMESKTVAEIYATSDANTYIFKFFVFWMFTGFVITAIISLKMRLMQHWASFRNYLYINGIYLIFASLMVLPLFWDFSLMQSAHQTIRLIFLSIALIHGMLLAYYRMQYEFINIFVRPSLVYFTLAGIIVLAYQFGIRNITDYLRQYPFVNVEWVELLLLLGLIFLLQPARIRLQSRVNALFFQETKKFQESVQTISKQLKSSINIKTLFTNISNHLQQILEVEQVNLIRQPSAEANSFAATIDLLQNSPEPVLFYHEARGDVAQEFAAAKLEMVVAISEEKSVIHGLLNVGKKQFNKTFSTHDIHFLKTIANQLAISIKNAKLIEEHISLERVMFKQDNLSSLGQIAASITHEVKNPLSAINTLVQVMQEEMPEGKDLKDSLVMIEKEIKYLNRILTEIVKFSDPESVDQQLISVREVLKGILVLLRTEAKLKDVSLTLESGKDYRISGTLQGLKKIFFNLIFNAIHACSEGGGTVDLKIYEKNGFVEVRIIDTGPGLPENRASDIFEPYFTTKTDGAGLGLTIVKENVTNMNGSIIAQNRQEGGAQFTVKLPLVREAK